MTRLADPLSAYLGRYGLDVARPTIRLAAPRLPEPSNVPITPEEEASLLSRVGHGALSGLAMVGNLLDLPGSMVRDVASSFAQGQFVNPFDQLLDPLSHSQTGRSTSGRDLLTQFGMRPNVESGIRGWWDDPGEGVRDVAGFGAELLLDPFLVATGPTKAAIKAIGVNPVTRAVGSRLAATRPGAAIAGAASDIGQRANLLGRQLFEPAALGRKTKIGQETARKIYSGQLAATRQTLADVLPQAARLPEASGQLSPELAAEAARVGRQMAEGVAPRTTDEMGHAVMAVRQVFDEVRERNAYLGRPSKELEDNIDYWARQMGVDVQELIGTSKPRDPRPLLGTNAAAVGRLEVFKGFKEGTEGVQELLTNPTWQDLIDDFSDAVESGGRAKALDPVTGDPIGKSLPAKSALLKSIRDRIENEYGDRIVPAFQKASEKDPSKLLFRTQDGKLVSRTREQIAAHGQELPDGNVLYALTRFGKPAGEELLAPVMADRYAELAKQIVGHSVYREKGLFTNHYMVDAYHGIEAERHAQVATENVFDMLANPAVVSGSLKRVLEATGEEATTIGDVLKQMRVNPDRGAELIAERRGLALPAEGTERASALQKIRKQVIDPQYRDELLEPWDNFSAPQEVGTLGKLFDSSTALFKAGVLSWIARYVRDVTSGAVRNVEAGLMGPFSGAKAGVQAHGLLQNKSVAGLAEIPAVRDWVAKQGLELSDETASNAVREMYASMKASPSYQNTDVTGVGQAIGGLGEFLQQIPGRGAAGGILPSTARVVRTAAALEPGSSLNPLKVRGVYDLAGNIRRESEFGVARAGDMIGRYTDDINRLTPFIVQLKKGADPAEAMTRIGQAQVEYAPRSFTKFERQLKRIFPFYSFSSRQIPYLTRELIQRPGGRLGQLLRAQRLASESDRPLPEHVSQTAAIPLGESDDGTQRFLTGLGLMHEDPLSLVGTPLNMLTEGLSRANPLLKAPLELATGESFFQRGPMGGRDIADLDPALGRTLTNVGLLSELPGGGAPAVGGRVTEHLLSNSPLARLLTTARTLTDPRKRLGGTVLPGESLVNVFTGLRISDVSPAQQDRALEDAIGATARGELGGRIHERVYIPKAILDETRQRDPAAAERMEAFNQLQRLVDKRQRERRIVRQQAAAVQTAP